MLLNAHDQSVNFLKLSILGDMLTGGSQAEGVNPLESRGAELDETGNSENGWAGGSDTMAAGGAVCTSVPELGMVDRGN